MSPHSSTLAWKIPWTEEPGRLKSMVSHRVRHDWATSLSLFTFMPWRRKWQPTPCSCLENPRDGGAWWAAVYGVARSRTWLKWLSSSSSSIPSFPYIKILPHYLSFPSGTPLIHTLFLLIVSHWFLHSFSFFLFFVSLIVWFQLICL